MSLIYDSAVFHEGKRNFHGCSSLDFRSWPQRKTLDWSVCLGRTSLEWSPPQWASPINVISVYLSLTLGSAAWRLSSYWFSQVSGGQNPKSVYQTSRSALPLSMTFEAPKFLATKTFGLCGYISPSLNRQRKRLGWVGRNILEQNLINLMDGYRVCTSRFCLVSRMALLKLEQAY